MTFSLLTYNVLFNKAFVKVEKMLDKYRPDILCFQEVETKEENLTSLEKFGYKLADYSNSFIKFGKVYGIATYFNTNFKAQKLKLIKTDSFNLPKSLYEVLTTIIRILKGENQPRTILRTDFLLTEKKKTVVIYNVHLSLFGINRTRTKQIEKVLNHGIKEDKFPLIITGDFNYFPYRRKKLENLMTKHGFREATRNINYTIRYPNRKFTKYSLIQNLAVKIIRKYVNHRLKVDYTFYKNLELIKTERIEKEFSDHYPIISTFNAT